MRFSIGLILLTLAASAHADPVTAVVAIGSWVVANAAVVAAVVVVAGSYYQSTNARKQAKNAAAKAREEANAALEDRTLTAISDDSPERTIYGRARVGSNIVAVFTSGDKDQYKHLVCVHAAHECDAIEKIWIANKELSSRDSNGNVLTGNYTSDNVAPIRTNFAGGTTFVLPYTPDAGSVAVVAQSTAQPNYNFAKYVSIPCTVSGNTVTIASAVGAVTVWYTITSKLSGVQVRVHLGGASDPVDSYLNSLFPTEWPTTSVLRGYCYTVVRLDLNNPEFQSGIPPIEVLIRGKKVLDPRNGVTSWRDNPALCLYDYLRNSCGIASSDIPTSYVIAAATACEMPIASQGGMFRYTCNGAFTSDADKGEIINQLAGSMAGSVCASTWEMFAGVYSAPIGTLEQTDIVGSLSIQPAMSDADLHNGYKGKFAGVENDYVSEDYKPYQNATYRAADGIDAFGSETFPFTNTTQRVHNLCRILTEDARNGFTVKADFSMKAFKYKVGNRILFNMPLLGISSKVMRVVDKTFNTASGVSLTLKEDAASIWDESDTVNLDDTPTSSLPDPFVIEPLEGLTLQTGTVALEKTTDGTIRPRILVSWSAPSRMDCDIEIECTDIISQSKATYTIAPNDTQFYIPNVTEANVYAIRAVLVNRMSQARSPARFKVSAVVGKAEAPSNVTGASVSVVQGGAKLTWTKPTDVDYSETEWRYGTTFAAGTRIFRGTATECVWLAPAQGNYTLWAVNYDTTGNTSTTPTQIALTFGASGLISWDNISGGPGGDGNLCGNPTCWGGDTTGWDGGIAAHDQTTSGFFASNGVTGTRWVLRAENRRDSLYGARFSVRSGDQFSCAADIVHSGAVTGGYGVRVGVLFWDANGAFLAAQGAYLPPSETWGHKTGTAVAPTNAAEGQVWVQLDGYSNFNTPGNGAEIANVSIKRQVTSEIIADDAVTTPKIIENAATDVSEFAAQNNSLTGSIYVETGDVVVAYISILATSYAPDGESVIGVTESSPGGSIPMYMSGTPPYLKNGTASYVSMRWGTAHGTGTVNFTNFTQTPAGTPSPTLLSWRLRLERIKR